jgi:hypothetical protein
MQQNTYEAVSGWKNKYVAIRRRNFNLKITVEAKAYRDLREWAPDLWGYK